MRIISAKPLEHADFLRYGVFSELTAPQGDTIGEPPVKFYRDMQAVYYGSGQTGYSVVQTWRRDMVIEEAERHTLAVEGLLPLDGDVVIFVAPAALGGFSGENAEAFIVPKGTLIFLKAGVWHKAPFPIDKDIVCSLIILPERTYANDCFIDTLSPEKTINIEYVK